MATTERAEREVVVLLGVPGPASLGVIGSEGGGGTEWAYVNRLYTLRMCNLTVYEHARFVTHGEGDYVYSVR